MNKQKIHFITYGDNKYKNETTNEYVKAIKKINFWKFPQILIVCFKRFENNSRKINKLIDFPVNNLNLIKEL